MARYQCHACGREVVITVDVKVRRGDACEGCDADLHCCLNCRFYDKRLDRCAEDQDRFIRNRDRSNFCDAFVFAEATGPGGRDEVADAKAKLANLFKKL